MVNIKKIITTVLVASIITMLPYNVIIANAKTTLPYKDVEGVQCVNLVELAKLKGGQLSDASHEVFGKGYNITLDGKSVIIYEEAPYIFVDGKMTTLKSEVFSADGLEFNFPVMQTPAKDGDGFLIPMYVVEKSLGIKGSEEGIVVETPKEEEKEDTNTGNNNSNNSGSNNGNNSSNGNSGSNNGSNSGNNGNTTPTPKPDPEPKPPVQPEKPSGMAFSTFASKLPGMGFDDTGVYWENGNKMGVVYATSGEATLSLRQNSDEFNNVIKNCLNMLLPTGGNKVYNIVTNPFSNQTIKVDGRVVAIEQTTIGVGIKIYDE